MGLVEPGIGLLFWMSIAFVIVWVILGKTAWKPILKAIKEREQSIENALNASEKAREEVANLKSDVDKMKAEARVEREKIMKEARDAAAKIVMEAQEVAKLESNKIIANAQDVIQNEKRAAMSEIKSQVAQLSISIAEKLLRKNLSTDKSQKDLVDELLKEVKAN